MSILTPNMQEIADVIIRPARHIYKISDLGAKTLMIQGHQVSRLDFEIKNKKDLTLKCSYFSKDKQIKTNNILIYLHCNSGCRVQGLAYLRLAIEHDFNYIVFDFAGSGLSQGKYVSLGFNQASDLQAVISYVKEHINSEAKFCIWGRSMGAVTALRYLSLHHEHIRVAVFDSPFQSLRKLFLQIGKQRTPFPQILLSVAFKYIKPIIISKADFDIDEVDVNEFAGSILTPGIFIASKQDSLIPFSQIDDIFNKYNGEKQMFFIQESHNQARNMNVIRKIFKTLKKQLLLSEQTQLKKQKTSFFSILNQKDLSKKKLQLTIKSLSQRQLKYIEPFQLVKKSSDMQMSFGKIDHRQSSCLFPTLNDKKQKKNSQYVIPNHSQTFFDVKRKPLASRPLLNENLVISQLKQSNIAKPKFAGQAKQIEIKMKIKPSDGRSRQRKTLQHISSKRPPFVQLKGVKQLRNSFEVRFRN